MPTTYKAIPCQGFPSTWGGSALYNVQQLEVDLTKGLPTGRTTAWSPKQGTVKLIGFSSINLPYSEYGRRKTLEIVCPVKSVSNTATITILSSDCIYQDVNVQAQANGALTFAYVFTVMDTVGAPTNP